MVINKKAVAQRLYFLVFYTKAKLEAESFRHFAGYLWWILDPLFGVGVYYLLFKVILNRGGPDYIQFLFVGLVTWKWFGDSVTKGASSILGNLGLFKKVKIDKYVFPTVTVLYNTWKFLIIFILILIVYSISGYGVTLNHLFLIPLLTTQFLMLLGASFFLAAIMPFFPDLKFIVTYGMRLMFYPSGVLFSLSRLPEKYQLLIRLNPMAGLIQSYRNIIMHGGRPEYYAMLYSACVGIILGGVGLYLINKYEQEYPKLS